MLKKLSATPYILWSIVFIIFPLIFIVGYSLSVETATGISFSLDNFKNFMDPIYIKVLLRSLKLAVASTLMCLILGYPMAMILSKMKPKAQKIAVLLFVLPMWMNFLLRTYAWMAILGKNGFINKLLGIFGLHLNLLYNEGAVLLGMVYNFLPFMVLPIYTVLTKIDSSLIEAAEDLGADHFTITRKIIFPLSLPGVISGITMVFMPAVSTFVISNLLGGGQQDLIGNLVEKQFLLVKNWHFGASISVILMTLILITINGLSYFDKTKGGESKW